MIACVGYKLKMSSASVETPAVVKQPNNKNRKNMHLSTNSQRKHKLDRSSRKRSKSFSGCLGKIKSMKPVLPTKFLLGGNINDPLNLNSLQDEEINRAMNAVTPKSSPIPTPPRRKGRVEVIIPSNIHDPLNLIDCADDAEYEQQLASPVKKGRKKRIKRKRTTSACIESTVKAEETDKPEAKTPEVNEDSAKIPEESAEAKPKELSLDLSPVKKEPKKRKSEEHKDAAKKFKLSMDKIVSPVIPQPGAWLKRKNTLNNWKPKPKNNKDANEKSPVFKERDKQFQYGNYNR